MLSSTKTKSVALVFLSALVVLAIPPLSAAIDKKVKHKRTAALVTYAKTNLCGDSSTECYTEEIHWLIDNGADVNARMPNGDPVMRWCAKRDDIDIAQHLQRAGARPDVPTQRIIWRVYKSRLNDTLWRAIDDASLPEIQRALAAGADVNFSADGETPLSQAIASREITSVKFLLSQGANARVKYEGESLLGLALRHGGDPQMLALLKKAGAPTNKNIEFFIAIINNRPRKVREGLQAGINVNTTNSGAQDGWTPLMWAASYYRSDIVRLLLHSGANPHIKDGDEGTALHYAEAEFGDWSRHTTERAKTIRLLKKAMKQ